MLLAYDFPLLSLFWSMFILFLWVIWLFLLFRTIVDIFRSDDLSGVAKVLWLLFVLVLPYLGVFVYLIARGDSMTKRDAERYQAQQEQFRTYVRDAAGSGGGGVAEELEKLASLRDRGVIDDAEFQAQKAKLLA